ncbi:hypothetical protein [Streptomyces sp. NPDC053720]
MLAYAWPSATGKAFDHALKAVEPTLDSHLSDQEYRTMRRTLRLARRRR